ncbi:competence type IV pilus major pilin ComGC [Erysipelothrix rhusiopathiae]|uniref:competence type IV pilus major pilin ComGC n=1 Tax=Erysipelothrix rhusiopathiae TaxID=1648 RepID=UPI002B245363|nr:competence type IV pilus major pilin ComGC [Erysipelothrix rhusiopathiae]WRB92303.1 competence type IV pilus major pilin ComGC [Erysipelothrix rhusiopathiae]
MKQGFTLIEMVLVMTIIAIIFMLTLPNIQKTITMVNRKGCDAQKKIVDAAIMQYKINYDELPTTIDHLINAGYLRENQYKCFNGEVIQIADGQAV